MSRVLWRAHRALPASPRDTRGTAPAQRHEPAHPQPPSLVAAGFRHGWCPLPPTAAHVPSLVAPLAGLGQWAAPHTAGRLQVEGMGPSAPRGEWGQGQQSEALGTRPPGAPGWCGPLPPPLVGRPKLRKVRGTQLVPAPPRVQERGKQRCRSQQAPSAPRGAGLSGELRVQAVLTPQPSQAAPAPSCPAP